MKKSLLLTLALTIATVSCPLTNAASNHHHETIDVEWPRIINKDGKNFVEIMVKGLSLCALNIRQGLESFSISDTNNHCSAEIGIQLTKKSEYKTSMYVTAKRNCNCGIDLGAVIMNKGIINLRNTFITHQRNPDQVTIHLPIIE